MLECQSVETAWIRWRAKLLYHAEQFIQRRRVHATFKPHPWMTPDLRQEIKAKHSLCESFKCTQTSDVWGEFRKHNRLCKLLKIAKSNFICIEQMTANDQSQTVQDHNQESSRNNEVEHQEIAELSLHRTCTRFYA